MAQSFLSTKLTIPPARPDLVPRPQLVDRLRTVLSRKLTLVSAPAGYGKTTLLSEWASRCGFPVAWISLDDADNDLARFLSYLAAALESIRPEIGRDLAARLRSPRLPPMEELLHATVNAIEQVPAPFALVLDDYHLIHEQEIHAALMFLLEHLPAPMHVVVASRGDPPLRLARMRARSELDEIRLNDLRFSPDEVARFLNQTMGLDLNQENIAVLADRTEGWIAGLQMAAISIRGSEKKAEFIRTFSGTNRYILDFLAEEIFQQQPQEIQAFLLRTSILNRMCAELCDGILKDEGWGMKDGKRRSFLILHPSPFILDLLDRSNLFILPLDDERRWYRYHQLFLDILRKRLMQTLPAEIPDLHRKASAWYWENGFPTEAIDHALAAGDFEQAANLIEKSADSFLMRSEVATFLGWANRLPKELIYARPDLMLSYTWVLLLTDAPQAEVLAYVDRAEPLSESVGGKLEVIRAFIDFSKGNVIHAGDRLRRALTRLPEGEVLFRTIATWMLSISYVTSGDFQMGEQSLEETVRTSLEMGNLLTAAGSCCQLAEVHLRKAQIRAARQDFERALAISTAAGGQRLPVASRALIGLGEVHREGNNLDAAVSCVQEGIDLAASIHMSMAMGGYICLARIRQARGETAGADWAIDRAFAIAESTKSTGMDDIAVMNVRAQLQIARGDLEAAGLWMQERGLGETFDPAEMDDQSDFDRYHMRKYECLVAARWWIATGRAEKALPILEALRVRMEAQGRMRLVLEARMVAALAYQKLGDLPTALSELRQALLIAEPEGYTRLFLDEGPSMNRLLEEAARHSITPEYSRRLLEAFRLESKPVDAQQPAPPARSDWVETLSEREVALLSLIAEGLSNQEIARRLFISLPTVKWHTGNIFGKLGVHSRTQAVAKARAAGILSPD